MITFHKMTMAEFKEAEARQKIKDYFALETTTNVSIDEVASKFVNEYVSFEKSKQLIKEYLMIKE